MEDSLVTVNLKDTLGVFYCQKGGGTTPDNEPVIDVRVLFEDE